ncbi:hypothetical protein M378DRAFT_806171 [Amanita muscaria Koide BX008]|uniref:Uncharacterized protein n=1 Tax=Amanita muscaria (strain Koide BX008) TaxID=946122 RepID=A0A0C2T6D5_AMAMK|nr:hypothetical protein M378DRAFT_806171 [Amanita muscaria Koide BX008]
MATAYSSFFASGLLAPPVSIYSRKDHHGVNDDDFNMLDSSPAWKGRGLSPAAPSSPMPVPDHCDTEYDRATTPTPVSSRSRAFSNASTISTDSEGMMMSWSNRLASPDFSTANVMTVSAGADVVASTATCDVGSTVNQSSLSPSQPQSARKLRRRRSSLAGASSPKSAIKSASRSAGHALELQKHLMGSPLRARSSSVSLVAAATDMMMTGGVGGSNIFIPEQNTFIGRLRSGSISSLRFVSSLCFWFIVLIFFGRRKPLRRASMQPPAPPPTAPLPELPQSLLNMPTFGFLESLNRTPLAKKSPTMDDLPTAPGVFRKNRDRSYSINTYDRIDEEMKEN